MSLGFTSIDRKITIADVDYHPQGAIDPSSVKQNSALESNNLDVKGLIDSNLISDLDLRAGKFNGERVRVFIADFITGEVVKTLANGRWGQVQKTDQTWSVTIRTPADILQQSVHQSLGRSCRWSKRLTDPRCGVNLNSFIVTTTVTGLSGNKTFTLASVPSPALIYNWSGGAGYVEFTTGSNAGYKLAIDTVQSGGLSLRVAPPYEVEIGDELKIIPGCDGTMGMCKNNFDNIDNWGGIAEGLHFFPTKEDLRR
jgi:uncharacterized phage protein (TIGR02218 family)